ncbi:MAG: hypothetical protein PQJ49_05020 [Sphaerochaetaceae bacterium]|nr:hypothetical protein [Sphaerochaetaceae bacterium]
MDIEKRIKDKRIKFSSYAEDKMYREMLMNYENKLFTTAAVMGSLLFERIITVRLIREPSIPVVLLKDNTINEQLSLLKIKEEEVINGSTGKRGFSFKQITTKLKDLNIIDTDKKNKLDSFYDTYRNPILHHLSLRLFKTIFNREPIHTFELDSMHDEMYERLAKIVLKEIEDLSSNGGFVVNKTK